MDLSDEILMGGHVFLRNIDNSLLKWLLDTSIPFQNFHKSVFQSSVIQLKNVCLFFLPKQSKKSRSVL